jgi:hypothetical protein
MGFEKGEWRYRPVSFNVPYKMYRHVHLPIN